VSVFGAVVGLAFLLSVLSIWPATPIVSMPPRRAVLGTGGLAGALIVFPYLFGGFCLLPPSALMLGVLAWALVDAGRPLATVSSARRLMLASLLVVPTGVALAQGPTALAGWWWEPDLPAVAQAEPIEGPCGWVVAGRLLQDPGVERAMRSCGRLLLVEERGDDLYATRTVEGLSFETRGDRGALERRPGWRQARGRLAAPPAVDFASGVGTALVAFLVGVFVARRFRRYAAPRPGRPPLGPTPERALRSFIAVATYCLLAA